MADLRRRGVIEIISQDFAIGWAAEDQGGRPVHVYAAVGDSIFGFAAADIRRDDLDALAAAGALHARAFAIVFDRPVPVDDLDRLKVHVLGDPEPLERRQMLRAERPPRLQIFVLGSPRSGTSELAASLAAEFGLPWLGEGHAAPRFADAAVALAGDAASSNGLLRFMARQRYRDIAIQSLRRAYYFMHGSASFLDKTPGTGMIRAAPFLAECFADARFIYLRRNGISNVLSRVAKFGGPFDRHCADWAAAMDIWAETRTSLPHFLQVDQEDMLEHPGTVAGKVAAYLSAPEAADGLAGRFATGRREHTGAGARHASLATTGWSEEQNRIFRRICTATMLREGYLL